MTQIQPTPPDMPNMPKLPPSIFVSLVTAVLGVLGAVGLPISDQLSTAIITLAGVLAVAIPVADAWLRRARLAYLSSRETNEARVASENRLRAQIASKDRPL